MTRNIHRWAAHLMVFFVFLHMMRVFYHGAYKPPREFNWVVGVVLLFMTIMLSFSGYLLPWDQIAYWAITIGTNFGSYFPIVNTPTKLMLLGGLEVGQNTLLRFYVLHVIFLPLVDRHLPGRPLLADPQGRRDPRGRSDDSSRGETRRLATLGALPTRRDVIATLAMAAYLRLIPRPWTSEGRIKPGPADR